MGDILLCNRCLAIPRIYVASVDGSVISSFDDNEFINIASSSKISYESQTENSPAGTILIETVTIQVKLSKMDERLKSPFQFYILSIFTTDGNIVVGSKCFPAKKEISGSELNKTITFIAKRPL